jgi:flavin reductase (DIM6/NTAB) family NADH-FMN oxidoreductase RutF
MLTRHPPPPRIPLPARRTDAVGTADLASSSQNGGAEFRQVLSAFPTGVVAVAACVDSSSPLGIAASSFTSVSLRPPIVSVCVGHSSTTWPRLRSAVRIGISVLAASQEDACRRLSARGVDRFAGLSWRATPGGAVLLEGASAWLECSLDQEVSVGDHDVIMLRVHDLGRERSIPPLVVHGSRYRRLRTEPGCLPGDADRV